MANENSDIEYVDLPGLETYARNTYLPLKGRVGTLETGKVDKVAGKGLSTNDYTTAEKEKLASLEPGGGGVDYLSVVNGAVNITYTA